MYNHKLVYLTLTLAVLELLSLIVLGYLYFAELQYDFVTLVKILSVTSALLQIGFFVILIFYTRSQTRYILLGSLSILLMLSFQPLLFTSLNGPLALSSYADVNFAIGVALIAVAVNISVDDTTYPFVKHIITANTFALILYRTPAFFILIWLVERFFDSTENIIMPVWIGVIVSQYLVFAVINILKAKIVNRIDFI